LKRGDRVSKGGERGLLEKRGADERSTKRTRQKEMLSRFGKKKKKAGRDTKPFDLALHKKPTRYEEGESPKGKKGNGIGFEGGGNSESKKQPAFRFVGKKGKKLKQKSVDQIFLVVVRIGEVFRQGEIGHHSGLSEMPGTAHNGN